MVRTLELLRILLLFSTLLCRSVHVSGSHPRMRRIAGRTYDVRHYKTAGDGVRDDTTAFLAAWHAACRDVGNPTFLVPRGRTFLLGKVDFKGPCKSPIHVKVDGNIKRSKKIWGDKVMTWILFMHLTGLRIDGSGQFDGQGQVYWACKQLRKCKIAPYTLTLLGTENVELSGLKFVNSSGAHVVLGFSKNVAVHDLTITAPDGSPNTDGIHVEQSQDIKIWDSNIGTGDDCVSIGSGSIDVTVSYITCGPGHGISIGSLGRRNTEGKVERIEVYNSRFSNTQNGVRIKSWQGGFGYAKGILFQNISLNAVQNPILIDQYYCPWQVCKEHPSAVSISDVRYVGVSGTTVSDAAISLNCSASVPCRGIFMKDINIWHAEAAGEVTANCINARGTKKGTVAPDVPCLSYHR